MRACNRIMEEIIKRIDKNNKEINIDDIKNFTTFKVRVERGTYGMVIDGPRAMELARNLLQGSGGSAIFFDGAFRRKLNRKQYTVARRVKDISAEEREEYSRVKTR